MTAKPARRSLLNAHGEFPQPDEVQPWERSTVAVPDPRALANRRNGAAKRGKGINVRLVDCTHLRGPLGELVDAAGARRAAAAIGTSTWTIARLLGGEIERMKPSTVRKFEDGLGVGRGE